MSRLEKVDPTAQKFRQNWTRNKHTGSQINGKTEISLHNRILRSNAKAHKF
ncbi:hypothetical protein JOD29_002810 [Lysinibacillus composti]|uniref:YpzG family protein n=1 Tax=Lysinibacillus composti TaxID=720633 RepID=A0A3N9UN13_9BACI|nr:YpzG family protein [Lysinibacillus composti]MBM7609540.1 hypothetical protein [Lysinibacillus composti]RQW73882.1 YpzG family protein [Lysinibacillus composti]